VPPNNSPCDPFGRPFGRLVNISLDMTRHQGWVSSSWRFRVPSRPGLVSFQGTWARCGIWRGASGCGGTGLKQHLCHPMNIHQTRHSGLISEIISKTSLSGGAVGNGLMASTTAAYSLLCAAACKSAALGSRAARNDRLSSYEFC